jgi:hypothetical protein
MYSLPDEGGDVDSVGSAFIDEIISSWELNEDESDPHLELAGDSVSQTRKRTINDGEKIDDRPLQISKSNRKGTKQAHYDSELKSDIAKYLADKLAKNLNVSSIKIPWSKLKKDDLINWPSDVKFDKIYKMNMKELQRVHEQVKKKLLDFSPEFLSRMSDRNQSRSVVAKYLADKLAKNLNVSSIKIPWSKLKEGDIINWPSDVKFKKIHKMTLDEVENVQELAKKDLLDFSPEVLNFLKSKSTKSEFHYMIRAIETALCNKLNAGTNKQFKQIPWTVLKKEDVINWPEGVPWAKLSEHRMKHLRLLHKLRDVIFFSKDFLKRLSDPNVSISRYTISPHKHQTLKHVSEP